MSHDPERWLEGGSDDAQLRSWMQLGADELAPRDVLSRVAAAATQAEDGVVDVAPGVRGALTTSRRLVSPLHGLGALLLLAGVAYVVWPAPAAQSPAPTRQVAAAPAVGFAPSSSSTPDRVPSSSLAQSDSAPASPHEAGPPLRTIRPRAGESEPSFARTRRATPKRPEPTRAASAAASDAAARPVASTPADLPPVPGAAHAQTDARAQTAAASSPTAAERSARPHLHATQRRVDQGTQREQLIQLESAQRLLREQPAQALTLMQEHARTYPASWLAEERDALIVRALLALHRTTQARAALERFAARYPESPQLRQLERLLANP
jgi:hypothetical protein